MTAQNAFFFDASFCSGCKACQAACKDKNNLPPGLLWRRVVEVTGGAWHQDGDAWNNTVFTYNISIACNHCVHPKCAGICPTNAYRVREDGIVILDTSKCMGCGYCAWACPYGAPQYDRDAGHMSKCDLCFDQIDQGLPPDCVAACPMRVLAYGEPSPLQAANELRLWDVPPELHPYPLPEYSHTQPRLTIRPHPAMNRSEEKFVANREEVQPRLPSAWEEVPLLLFTLLAQMAAGGFWAALWLFPQLWTGVSAQPLNMRLLPVMVVGACLGAAVFASLAHLGTKNKAWLALANLRRSWLSREILFLGLFGAGWLFSTLENAISRRSTLELLALTAALGLGLLHSMSQVYRLRSVPAWNTWRTNAGFLISAVLLGQSLLATLFSHETHIGIAVGSGTLILLLVQRLLMQRQVSGARLYTLRIALIMLGMAVAVAALVLRNASWISLVLFALILLEETVGRWSFYQARI
jgi:anaerobic dimethyl sulfoxide reductase subunit B (iron-sulfur subunit)